MGIFDNFFDEDKDKKRKEEQEKEMDILGLDEWEKDEVRNGNYDPDCFEDDELEDDDYYFDE